VGDTHRIDCPAGSRSLLSLENAGCSADLTAHNHNDHLCCMGLFTRRGSFRGLGIVSAVDRFCHFGVMDTGDSASGQPKATTGHTVVGLGSDLFFGKFHSEQTLPK